MFKDSKIKLAQNILKHILVWEFLKSDEILEIKKKLEQSTSNRPCRQVHRSEKMKSLCSSEAARLFLKFMKHSSFSLNR